jgi:hypothetical protein
MMRRAITSALGLVLGACASVPAMAPSDGTPMLELGTGTYAFVPVTDGQTLPLIHGAQGGWHFWVAVRVTGSSASSGSLTLETQPADESSPARIATIGVHFDPPDATGGRSFLGLQDIMSDPSCAVGTLIRVRATVTLPDGTRVSDERHVVPGPGDSPPPPCVR